MAARNKNTHDYKTRQRIQASQLINRLENHVLGEVELSATQVQAAKILLGKVIPDISSVQWSGELEANSTTTHKLDKDQLKQIVKELNTEY
jgi:hypothetical protein